MSVLRGKSLNAHKIHTAVLIYKLISVLYCIVWNAVPIKGRVNTT
ncbi:hypothetical protein VCHA57P511_90083 [Vibrio chagasii]|nr:hypothetical protein VCHA57P511_90083 [Vibrio chagasii]